MTKPQREFRCRRCGRVDVYDADAAPVHCNQEMQAGEIGEVRDDQTINLDIIKLKVQPEVQWSIPIPPDDVWEVRVIKIGAAEGWEQASEKIGWLAYRENMGYEYRLVEGIPFGVGTALTRNAALEAMYIAIAY